MSLVNAELREAILNRKRERTKQLLANGADINHAVNGDRDTMLHHALTLIQVHHILGYGAEVNACNVHGKTALHSAAETGKPLEVVQSLIAHCADVNARDKYGNYPLNYAVRRVEKDYEVIKELVLRGSVVMQNRIAWDSRGQTPFKDAVLRDDTKCVRALIKYHLILSFSGVPETWVLADYCRHRRYNSMKNFYNDCCSELSKMEREVVHKKTRTTLLNVIRRRFSLNEVVENEEKAIDTFANRCLWLVRTLRYSIYNDVILSKLGELLDRMYLMKQMREVEVYTCEDLIENVSPNADQKITENNYAKKTEMEPNQRAVLNKDFQLSKGHTDKKVDLNTDLNKAKGDKDKKVNSNVMSTQAEVDTDIKVGPKLNLNNAYDLRVEFHEVDQSQVICNEKLNLDNAYDLRAEFHEEVDQPQKILNKEFNLDNAYDLRAEFHDEVDQPENVILNEKLNPHNSYDFGKDVEKVDQSWKVESPENTEEKPYNKVVLNGDLVATIAGYLEKSDLLTWIVAYYVPEDIPQRHEEEGSIDLCRKIILKRVNQSDSSPASKFARFME